MARLSGPRGWEIINTSKEFVNNELYDAVFNLITSMPKDERWLWGREIEDQFKSMVELMCLQLDIKNPRF